MHGACLHIQHKYIPSIIVFLYSYLRRKDNALFIYCYITIKVGKKLANIYGRSFSIVTFNCTYKNYIYIFNSSCSPYHRVMTV